MRSILRIALLVLLLAAAWSAWSVFGPTVSAPKGKYFYIKTGSTFSEVEKALIDQDIISSKFFFGIIADRSGYSKNVKPGRYLVEDVSSLINFTRMLKQGRQSPVKLVINKLRTKEDLASKIAANFETDSVSAIIFLTSNDSLRQFGLDTNTAMTAVIPNTYEFYWNSSFRKVFSRLHEEQEKFWNKERLAKAAARNLTAGQVYTLASIVEEESTKPEDKKKIASTYRNRIRKGMRLEADPTVKYALRNFGLKRILFGHLDVSSPYNTYRNTGLPPGPICTPSPQTIDAVLDSPETDYLFFAAGASFDGYHNFAATYSEHLVNARAYQRALDSLLAAKQQRGK